MKDLLLAVPSRGRPESIARLWKAMGETCQGDTTLLVGLDDDDPTRWDYPDGPEYVVRENLHQVVAWLNHLTSWQYRQRYRFTGTIGDDNVPRTLGWDTAMMDELGKVPFAFGNDLYPFRAPGALACHVFTRVEVIGALGYFGPPVLRHSYVDDVWMAWGRACGITFRPDVIIEHLHYTTGAPLDDTYARSQALMTADQAAYTAYCQGQLASDIATIGKTLPALSWSGRWTAVVTWDLLIATIPHRHASLCELLAELDTQWQPGLRVLLYRDNLNASIGAKRQVLLEAATAAYVSFADDDDMVARDFVAAIMTALADQPDYVGFCVEYIADGGQPVLAEHSLHHPGWDQSPPVMPVWITNTYSGPRHDGRPWPDPGTRFEVTASEALSLIQAGHAVAAGLMVFPRMARDLSHLNPLRRELALLGRFSGQYGEDQRWASEVRESRRVRTEAWLDRPLYRYRYSAADSAGTERIPMPVPLPELPVYSWLTALEAVLWRSWHS